LARTAREQSADGRAGKTKDRETPPRRAFAVSRRSEEQGKKIPGGKGYNLSFYRKKKWVSGKNLCPQTPASKRDSHAGVTGAPIRKHGEGLRGLGFGQVSPKWRGPGSSGIGSTEVCALGKCSVQRGRGTSPGRVKYGRGTRYLDVHPQRGKSGGPSGPLGQQPL